MDELTLRHLVENVHRQKSEGQTVELKKAVGGYPTKLYGTLSSFSNQDGGGVIIFGIDEDSDYDVVGVYDAQDLQKHVTEQANEMQPVIRPLFTVTEIEGKIIVAAEIPGVDVVQRPVYYRGAGKIRGSFIRVGEADEPMSEAEIYSYEAFKNHVQDDLRIVSRAKRELFDEDKISLFLNAAKRERRNLEGNVTDDQILELTGVFLDGVPTLAGTLAFSKFPQGYFPQLCITAVSIPGTDMGETGVDGERFLDNKRLTGSIEEVLNDALDFVKKNIRIKTVINQQGQREDRPEYPLVAVREAIVNALVHRDYSCHTDGIPVRIEIYNNRMEIVSPGGLYGRVSVESLGKIRPETRNVALANILELLHITENRYSGIPTIINLCRKAGLPEPRFENRRGEFKVIFFSELKGNKLKVSKQNVREQLLILCETPRTRQELFQLTELSPYIIGKHLTALLTEGKLECTMPEHSKSKNARFRVNAALVKG